MNYLIVIEYCGANYNGWQVQNKSSKNHECFEEGNKTVENELLKAIRIITKSDVKLSVSGRTDAGVHALNQVANFRLPFYYDLNMLKISLNGVLPRDICVKNIETVHDSFHATYDTISKTYLYKINSGLRSPLLSGMSWFIKEDLNIGLINKSASIFLGRNNFFNFAKREKGKKITNYYKIISDIKICAVDYGFDIFVEGEGFLRHMVRRIVGAIVTCGAGKIGVNSIKEMLDGKNSASGFPCAPPYGLFLYSVKYKHKVYETLPT